MSETLSGPEQFWGSERYPAWGARLRFGNEGISFEEFSATVLAIAERTSHRYTGFITRDETTGNVTSFTRTIAPRRKHGTPTPEECARSMYRLADAFRLPLEADPVDADSFRTLMGLHIGQKDSYDGPPDYAVDEVQAMLAARGLSSTATAAEVFTIRFGEGNTATPRLEAVADLRGPLQELDDIAELGTHMGQERFAFERFYGTTRRTVQMIESIHCQEREFGPITDRLAEDPMLYHVRTIIDTM
jgi:hypothetical protein